MPFVYRDKFRGEKIPTLEEAVEECIRLQLIIYFDVKGHPDEVQNWICPIFGILVPRISAYIPVLIFSTTAPPLV